MRAVRVVAGAVEGASEEVEADDMVSGTAEPGAGTVEGPDFGPFPEAIIQGADKRSRENRIMEMDVFMDLIL